MRALRSLALLAWLVGCSCEAPVATPPPIEPAPPVEPPLTLPSVDAELPEAVPAITISVRSDRFEVGNRALVGSWPEADRQIVGQMRPLGDADYPIVEREVDDASDALVVPGLREAVRAVVAVETARATVVHADGTTTIFAVRADADVHFARIEAALFAAGVTGLARPRLVVTSPTGERELRLSSPDGELEGAPAPSIAAPRVETTVELSPEGLTVHRGALRLGSGCGAEAAPGDAAAPTIPTASLSVRAIETCLDAIDPHVAITFSAVGTMRYADVVDVLVAMVTRHPVNLRAALR